MAISTSTVNVFSGDETMLAQQNRAAAEGAGRNTTSAQEHLAHVYRQLVSTLVLPVPRVHIDTDSLAVAHTGSEAYRQSICYSTGGGGYVMLLNMQGKLRNSDTRPNLFKRKLTDPVECHDRSNHGLPLHESLVAMIKPIARDVYNMPMALAVLMDLVRMFNNKTTVRGLLHAAGADDTNPFWLTKNLPSQQRQSLSKMVQQAGRFFIGSSDSAPSTRVLTKVLSVDSYTGRAVEPAKVLTLIAWAANTFTRLCNLGAPMRERLKLCRVLLGDEAISPVQVTTVGNLYDITLVLPHLHDVVYSQHLVNNQWTNAHDKGIYLAMLADLIDSRVSAYAHPKDMDGRLDYLLSLPGQNYELNSPE